MKYFIAESTATERGIFNSFTSTLRGMSSVKILQEYQARFDLTLEKEKYG